MVNRAGVRCGSEDRSRLYTNRTGYVNIGGASPREPPDLGPLSGKPGYSPTPLARDAL